MRHVLLESRFCKTTLEKMFKDKYCLVTGGASGIGRRFAVVAN